jgi:hypothetical protein
VPILAGPAYPDRVPVLGDVGHHDDLRAARDAPPLAEDIEFDLAEAAGEGDLLRRRDALVAKEDHAVFVVGALDRGECGIVERLRQIDAADFGAERGTGRDNLKRHRRFPSCCRRARLPAPSDCGQPVVIRHECHR